MSTDSSYAVIVPPVAFLSTSGAAYESVKHGVWRG